MVAKINGSTLHGVEAFRIQVEVNISNGMGYSITGLPDDSIKESLTRIAVVLEQHGFRMPRTKLVINLSPANDRKSGTAFDLPIAIAILLATGQVEDVGKLKDYWMVGELGLDGSLHPVKGTLCMAEKAKQEGYKGIILPASNAREAALIKGVNVYAMQNLQDVLSFIQSDIASIPFQATGPNSLYVSAGLDFAEVKGQRNMKRALEIAAAGGHNLIMIGAAGTAKSMLAERLPSILPPMSLEESLETTRIYSAAGNVGPCKGLITERPFRNPHHTATGVTLTGGGTIPQPGEVTLAHNGVLFLDEFAEFKGEALEALRQPLESRRVTVARNKMALEFPASCMLVAAMNPCLCGNFGHPTRECTCSKRAIYWYRRKVSGPLLERLDLQVEAETSSVSELFEDNTPPESSVVIRRRVVDARYIQFLRYQHQPGIHCNAQLPDQQLAHVCQIEPEARRFLLKHIDSMQLSARSYSRVLKVSRTIADLAKKTIIELPHVAEALHFRCFDKPLIIPFKGKKK